MWRQNILRYSYKDVDHGWHGGGHVVWNQRIGVPLMCVNYSWIVCICFILLAHHVCLCLTMIVYCVTRERMMLQVDLVRPKGRVRIDREKRLIRVFMFYVTDFYISFEFIIMDFGIIYDVINVLNLQHFWEMNLNKWGIIMFLFYYLKSEISGRDVTWKTSTPTPLKCEPPLSAEKANIVCGSWTWTQIKEQKRNFDSGLTPLTCQLKWFFFKFSFIFHTLTQALKVVAEVGKFKHVWGHLKDKN